MWRVRRRMAEVYTIPSQKINYFALPKRVYFVKVPLTSLRLPCVDFEENKCTRGYWCYRAGTLFSFHGLMERIAEEIV